MTSPPPETMFIARLAIPPEFHPVFLRFFTTVSREAVLPTQIPDYLYYICYEEKIEDKNQIYVYAQTYRFEPIDPAHPGQAILLQALLFASVQTATITMLSLITEHQYDEYFLTCTRCLADDLDSILPGQKPICQTCPHWPVLSPIFTKVCPVITPNPAPTPKTPEGPAHE